MIKTLQKFGFGIAMGGINPLLLSIIFDLDCPPTFFLVTTVMSYIGLILMSGGLNGRK